jgi:hypothetical protein
MISFLSRAIDYFFFISELMDLFVADRDQSAADQPNNLAEGLPPLQPMRNSAERGNLASQMQS